MRISDWSSDVCSSDLGPCRTAAGWQVRAQWPCFNSGNVPRAGAKRIKRLIDPRRAAPGGDRAEPAGREASGDQLAGIEHARGIEGSLDAAERTEEHTSELLQLMRLSYAVFCMNPQ